MLGLCFYELMYVMAILGVTFVLGGYILYNCYKSRIDTAIKFAAFHFISVVMIGIGFLFSELYIEHSNAYQCSAKADISIASMVFSIIAVVFISKKYKHRKYVYSFRINQYLAFLDMFLLVGVILMFVFEILG